MVEHLVLITVSGPDPKLVKSGLTPNTASKDGQTVLASTGLIFNALPGYIITSLLPIHPFLQPQFRSNPSTASGNYNSQTTLLPGTCITCSTTSSSFSTINSHSEEVYLERIIELKDIRATLRLLLTAPSASRWSLGWGSYSNNQLSLETQLDVGSHVVVLKLPPTADITRNRATLSTAATAESIDNLSSLQPGTLITAHGCPFGALVSLKFHNFITTGAISALLLERKQQPLSPVVALSDLKLLPGMEGGMVCSHKSIIGIVGPSLRAPEAHAELSVILSVTTVLDAVVQIFHSTRGNSSTMNTSSTKPSRSININTALTTVTGGKTGLLFSEALKAVVAVEAKGGWASGILVSSNGHILTNAHALPPASQNSNSKLFSCRVLVNNKIWVDAEIVHSFTTPIDLAVLKIKIKNTSTAFSYSLHAPMLLSNGVCTPGRSVAVVGYPLWRPSTSSSTPLVTVGTAAMMVPAAPAMPAVILTTADVHAGASGGAVLDLETGCLVGLVTSNTRLGRRSSTPPQAAAINTKQQPVVLFPHLNYCLGSAALAPVIEMLTTPLENFDWRAVERKLVESGVVEAWRSIRSMENLGTLPNEHTKRKLPPALAALMDSKIGNGGGAARPKL